MFLNAVWQKQANYKIKKKIQLLDFYNPDFNDFLNSHQASKMCKHITVLKREKGRAANTKLNNHGSIGVIKNGRIPSVSGGIHQQKMPKRKPRELCIAI